MNFEEGNFYLNDCPNSSSNQHKNQNFMNPKIRVCRYVSRKSHLHAQTQFNEKVENKHKKKQSREKSTLML